MHPTEVLHRLGGVGTRRQILQLADRTDLERLVRAGDVVRDARGRFALPAASEGLRVANAMSATLSHLSAAMHHGWEVKTAPERPHLTFPRGRNLGERERRACAPHWRELHSDDHDGRVTTKRRTLLDCLQTLPFDEALCVADSALRHEDLTGPGLVALAGTARGPGAARARRVARHADGRSANPFESTLRAIALPVRDLQLIPQQAIRAPDFYARPDLVDRDRMVVVEADSHTWHSSRDALRRDCRRYNGLVLRGWTVLRFAWEQVMFEPDYVWHCLEALARERPQPRSRRRCAA